MGGGGVRFMPDACPVLCRIGLHRWHWPDGCTPLRTCERVCLRCGKKQLAFVDLDYR